MTRLTQRLEALERRDVPPLRRWHQILRFEGQTEAEAVAAYEAANGPIGPDDGSILSVVIHKPFPAPGAPGSHGT